MTKPAEPIGAVAPIPKKEPSACRRPAETLLSDSGSLASLLLVTAPAATDGLGKLPLKSPPAGPLGGIDTGALIMPIQGAVRALMANGVAVTDCRGVRGAPLTVMASQRALPVNGVGPKSSETVNRPLASATGGALPAEPSQMSVGPIWVPPAGASNSANVMLNGPFSDEPSAFNWP